MDVLRIVKRIQVNEPDINGDDHHDSKITDTVGEVGEIEEIDDDSVLKFSKSFFFYYF